MKRGKRVATTEAERRRYAKRFADWTAENVKVTFPPLPKAGTNLTLTVARALSDAPISIRAISRRAAVVSHAQLARVVTGQRNATPTVARAVAEALDAIGAECVARAAEVRRSITHQQGRGR